MGKEKSQAGKRLGTFVYTGLSQLFRIEQEKFVRRQRYVSYGKSHR